jgi:hypothetical protein
MNIMDKEKEKKFHIKNYVNLKKVSLKLSKKKMMET